VLEVGWLVLLLGVGIFLLAAATQTPPQASRLMILAAAVLGALAALLAVIRLAD
jgi:hypothetical protein